jgi:hypothetical protein
VESLQCKLPSWLVLMALCGLCALHTSLLFVSMLISTQDHRHLSPARLRRDELGATHPVEVLPTETHHSHHLYIDRVLSDHKTPGRRLKDNRDTLFKVSLFKAAMTSSVSNHEGESLRPMTNMVCLQSRFVSVDLD